MWCGLHYPLWAGLDWQIALVQAGVSEAAHVEDAALDTSMTFCYLFHKELSGILLLVLQPQEVDP